jgi:plastocyanin
MASAGQAGYTANPAAAPAAGEGYGGNKTPEASADNITVRISGMRFEPSTITVQPGTTVTWIHEDGAPHTVTGENGALQSGTLTGGQRFSHTFEEGGSFDYACNFHPMMKGRVVVEESSS